MRKAYTVSYILFIMIFAIACTNQQGMNRRNTSQTKVNEVEPRKQQKGNITTKNLPIQQEVVFKKIPTREKEIPTLIKELKSKYINFANWEIVYADEKKYILHTLDYIVIYKNGIIENIIELEPLKRQAGVKAILGLSASPNGEYLTIHIKSIEQNDLQKVYLYRIGENELQEIWSKNTEMMNASWSTSSNFYALADVEGTQVNIYDLAQNTVRNIPFQRGSANELFVSDDGTTVVVSSNRRYMIGKENKLVPSEIINIPGNGKIMGYAGEDVLYYDNGVIYRYRMGKTEKVKEIGTSFQLTKKGNERAIFSDEIVMKVYDFKDREIYAYNLQYDRVNYIDFSPNSQKVIIIDHAGVRIMKYDGQQYITGDKIDFRSIGRYKWINKNVIAFVNLEKGFTLKSLNLETEEEKVLVQWREREE